MLISLKLIFCTDLAEVVFIILLAFWILVKDLIQAEADRVIDTLDPTGINRAIKGIRDMAAKAGKSVGDFITQNPEALVPGLGVPIWAARKITAGM